MQNRKPDLLDASGLRRTVVDLLSRRDYSRLELFRKLKQKAENPEDIDVVLDDFQQRNWQSDERFAESFLNSRYQRGLGPQRLKQELKEKGVASDIISLTLENLDVDWFQLALDTAIKKETSIKNSDANKKQKIYRFLAYRGFTSDQISAALDELSIPSSFS